MIGVSEQSSSAAHNEDFAVFHLEGFLGLLRDASEVLGHRGNSAWGDVQRDFLLSPGILGNKVQNYRKLR